MIKNYDGSTSIVSHTTSDYNNLRNSKQSIKIFYQQNYINMSPMLLMLRLILVIVLSYIGLSQSIIIETLPGFPGYLPFKLETGYVGVGESDEVQLFYYFIESERSPKDDPLMLWLTGGPGCSALSGLLFEIGNEVTHDPPMNIQGYLLGNPFTDANYLNSRVVFAHRMALLSDDLYENYNYLYAYIWANDRTVQEALHIRQGTKKEWLRCNKSLDYTENVYSSVIYHQNLTTKHCRALIYRYGLDRGVAHPGQGVAQLSQVSFSLADVFVILLSKL
ncbi:hypothetical protein CsSME_00047901 [Camellia sinensis var. sinensis]